MTSLLDGIRALVTPAFLSRTSAQISEPEAAVSKGLLAGLPALLLSLANHSEDTLFMGQVASLATSAAAADSEAMKTPAGNDWLPKLFGSNASTVTDSIARFAGLRSASAGSLLSLAAPLVIGYLGRLIRSDNLDAAGLARRLRSERGAYSAAIPAGFDMQSLLMSPADAVRNSVDAVRHIDVPAAAIIPQPSRSSGGWAIPLLLAALALGGLAWWASRERPVPVRASIENATANAVGTAGSTMRMLRRSLPGNIDISVPDGGMEDRLIAFLGSSSSGSNASLDFDRIGFETGSAALTPASRDQINTIATVLKAYPNVRVMVSGHTDAVGDESTNLALSRSRAQTVASALTALGVQPDRVRAEGHGSQNPVAGNDTEQGRAQNRRVVLQVQRG
jgi:outer membrane protein OmpA-like peptidoglycan-associated protein